jgi:hypothetical protein
VAIFRHASRAQAPDRVALRFFQETGFQQQALDLFHIAFDFFFIVGQADIFDQRAALERHGSPFDFQILDKRYGIAVTECGAVAVFYFDIHDCAF